MLLIPFIFSKYYSFINNYNFLRIVSKIIFFAWKKSIIERMAFSKRAHWTKTFERWNRESLRNLLILGFHFRFLLNLFSGSIDRNKVINWWNFIDRDSFGSFFDCLELFADFFLGKCNIVVVTKAWFSKFIIRDNLDYFTTLLKTFHYVIGLDLLRKLYVDLILWELLHVFWLILELRVNNYEGLFVDLHCKFGSQ